MASKGLKAKKEQELSRQHEEDEEAGAGARGEEDGAPKIKGSKDDIWGVRGLKAHGKTEEGYNIYYEEDLKINLPGSGNTPDCPFDCDCCF